MDDHNHLSVEDLNETIELWARKIMSQSAQGYCCGVLDASSKIIASAIKAMGITRGYQADEFMEMLQVFLQDIIQLVFEDGALEIEVRPVPPPTPGSKHDHRH